MDLEQALKKAPLFLAIIFSHFYVFLAEQWNHDVIASSKTGVLPNCSCKGSCARRPKVGKHFGMKLEYFIVIVIVKSFDHVCKLECMLGYK